MKNVIIKMLVVACNGIITHKKMSIKSMFLRLTNFRTVFKDMNMHNEIKGTENINGVNVNMGSINVGYSSSNKVVKRDICGTTTLYVVLNAALDKRIRETKIRVIFNIAKTMCIAGIERLLTRLIIASHKGTTGKTL